MATADLAEVTDGSRVPCTHRTTTAATEPAIKLVTIGGMVSARRSVSGLANNGAQKEQCRQTSQEQAENSKDNEKHLKSPFLLSPNYSTGRV
jgi:hypothetical protein